MLTELAQQARALTCIDILRIEALQNEKPNLIDSIQVNSIGPKEGRDLYHAGKYIPQVILDTICQSIATRFADGFLGNGTLDNWYEVADRHGRFDAGMRRCLSVLQSQNLESQVNQKFGIARRVWARRGVDRDGEYLERRSFERMRIDSDVVPDLSASQQEPDSRPEGEVIIEVYQPLPSAHSRPRRTSQPSWGPQQQPRDEAASPMSVETAQVLDTVLHFHHRPRSRTHRDSPINTDSQYHHRRSSSHSRREHKSRGTRRFNITTLKFGNYR